jgi:hypothetical protein
MSGNGRKRKTGQKYWWKKTLLVTAWISGHPGNEEL